MEFSKKSTIFEEMVCESNDKWQLSVQLDLKSAK